MTRLLIIILCIIILWLAFVPAEAARPIVQARATHTPLVVQSPEPTTTPPAYPAPARRGRKEGKRR